jgi:hypothetical protein
MYISQFTVLVLLKLKKLFQMMLGILAFLDLSQLLLGSQGILTIGINNDESAASEVAGAPGVVEWLPESL